MNVAAAYNRFVAANRTTIQGANGVHPGAVPRRPWRRRRRPITTASPPRSPTSTATTPPTQAICADTAALAEEAAAAGGDIRQLVAIADRFGLAPALPGGPVHDQLRRGGGDQLSHI